MFTPGFSPYRIPPGGAGGEVTAAAVRGVLGLAPVADSLVAWKESGDGTDLSAAYGRAVAAGVRTLYVPEGAHTWAAPQNYVQGVSIIGAKPMKTSGITGSKITANAGFLKNDNTTRKQIVLQRLHIIGNRTASSVGVDGPFGGEITECKIEGFDVLVRNMSGYLCFYEKNSFANAAIGIQTADANGTEIARNHFADNVVTQITTRDGVAQSGTNSGLPLSIYQNNFNMTDTTLFALKIRGQVNVRENYFEKFSGGAVESRFIDLEVNRFDNQGAIIEGNELNGQSSNATALYINGSHAPPLDNPCEGRFACNRIIGCNQSNAVVYGPNNRIPGFKVHRERVVGSYRTQHIPAEEEWTTIRLESDFTTSSATAVDVTGLAFTPDADAQYEIEAVLMCRSATGGTTNTGVGPRPGLVWPTNVGDGVIYTQQATSVNTTLPRYGNTSSAFDSVNDSIPDNTGSWPFFLKATFISPSNVSGTLKLTLRSEVAATNVTLKAGSYIKYRRII